MPKILINDVLVEDSPHVRQSNKLTKLLMRAMVTRPHTAAHLLLTEILDWPSPAHTSTRGGWNSSGDDSRTNQMIIDSLERWLAFHEDKTPRG